MTSKCGGVPPTLGGNPPNGNGGGGGFFSQKWAPGGSEPFVTPATFTVVGLNLLLEYTKGVNGGAQQAAYFPGATDTNFDATKDIEVLVVWAPAVTGVSPNDQVLWRLALQRQQVGHSLPDLAGGLAISQQATAFSGLDLAYTMFVLSTDAEKDFLGSLESFRLWLQRNDSDVLDTYPNSALLLRVVMYQGP